MGEPMRIVGLARNMTRLSGRSQDEIKIEFSGLHLGEKLYEELLAARDTSLPTRCAGLALARLDDRQDAQRVLHWLLTGAGAAGGYDMEVRQALRELLGHQFYARD